MTSRFKFPLFRNFPFFFQGLTFLVTGFDIQEGAVITESIAALGGRIVTNSFVGVPDFGVVPLTGAALKHAVNEVVTDLYIVSKKIIVIQ